MQLNSITEIVVFLVFVAAFMVFSLSPAIWLSEKLMDKYSFDEKISNFLTLIFTLCFASLASYFLYF